LPLGAYLPGEKSTMNASILMDSGQPTSRKQQSLLNIYAQCSKVDACPKILIEIAMKKLDYGCASLTPHRHSCYAQVAKIPGGKL